MRNITDQTFQVPPELVEQHKPFFRTENDRPGGQWDQIMSLRQYHPKSLKPFLSFCLRGTIYFRSRRHGQTAATTDAPHNREFVILSNAWLLAEAI